MGAGPAGAEDRLGDIDGTLEAPAYKDPGPVGLHGIDGIELAEIMRAELDAEFLCNALRHPGRVQSDGQYHHIEFFLFYAVVGGGIAYGDVLRYRVLFYYRCVAPEEPNPGKFLRSLVVSLEILPVGTDIVMEYRTVGLRVMILCQDHLFLGIGAAYGRTIAVAALEHLSRADALDPGYVMGMLQVGGAQYLTLVGPRWRIRAARSPCWSRRSGTLRSDTPPSPWDRRARGRQTRMTAPTFISSFSGV